jgi:Rps23 Pro-64 3,4-dihydroxylase Tpa1-like proline 4-hydroxylase
MMELNSYRDPFPYLIIKNLFTPVEYLEMTSEWMTLSDTALPPERTAGAKDVNGNNLKKNSGIFLDDIYKQNREASATLRHNRKLFDPKLTAQIEATNPTFGLIRSSSIDTTLISYYRPTDHYEIHYDYNSVTALTYFLPRGRTFSGGILRFVDYGVEIIPSDNETVVFLGCIRHEVTPIESDDDSINRVAMSQFIGNWR